MSNIINIDNDVLGNIVDIHSAVSGTSTPKMYVKNKQGFDYVDEAYMRHLLNKYYPGWSWEIIKYEYVGDKVITVHGRLKIIDCGIPRAFDSIAAHRIAKSKSSGDYVDIGNDLKSANSDCFKVALNRLCNIADDVYRKQVKDVSLSEAQMLLINEYISKIESFDKMLAEKVRDSISQMKINTSNFEVSIDKLESVINKKEKGEKS
jgi:hypothetical protein